MDWKASKFRSTHKLLNYINWKGQVCVFGDGPYDTELLNYFDGVLITHKPEVNSHRKER